MPLTFARTRTWRRFRADSFFLNLTRMFAAPCAAGPVLGESVSGVNRHGAALLPPDYPALLETRPRYLALPALPALRRTTSPANRMPFPL